MNKLPGMSKRDYITILWKKLRSYIYYEPVFFPPEDKKSNNSHRVKA